MTSPEPSSLPAEDYLAQSSATPLFSTPGGIAGISATMIGRDSAIQQLVTRFYALFEGGDTQFITILGDPGIGKSRLAYEFYQQVMRLPEPVRFYRFKSDPQRTAQPYNLIRQLIVALFKLNEYDPVEEVIRCLEAGMTAILGPNNLKKAHILGYLAGFDLETSPYLGDLRQDARQIRNYALRAIMQVIAQLTAQSPLVLVIENAHDVDDSSLDMIEQAAEAGVDMGMMIMCLAQCRLLDRRPHWGEKIPGAIRIALKPLDEHQSRRLVADILRKAGKLPLDLRNLIIKRAEGNPLYIEELIKTLIADGVIVTAKDKWQIQAGRLPRLRVPDTLRGLLRIRLTPLSAPERTFLSAAAVIGGVFWVRAATALLGHPADDCTSEAILRTLESHTLIVPQSEPLLHGEREYRFSHDLLREIIYEQIPPEQRSVYHQRMAVWLIARGAERVDSHAGLIAEHFERSGDLGRAGSWHARAGAHAHTTYAIDTTILHYQRAIQLLEQHPTQACDLLRCYIEIGQAQLEAAHFTNAVTSFRQARELAHRHGDQQTESRALERLSAIADDMSDPHAMRDYAQQALDLARQANDTPHVVLSMADLSLANNRLGFTQIGLNLAREALMLAEQTHDAPGIAKSLAYLALSYEHLGDLTAAMSYMQDSVARFRTLGDLTELAAQINNLGYIANTQGDFVHAITFLEEGLQIAREGGIRNMKIYLLSNLVTALVGLERYDQAKEAARRGIQMSELSRIKPFPDFYRALSAVYLSQKRVAEAIESAQYALDLSRQAIDPREVGASWCTLGMAIAALPESMGATPCFAESARLLSEPGLSADKGRTLRAWAAYELRNGDIGYGYELVIQACALFTQAGLPLELARTQALIAAR
ncbi:MAG: AAA family ATPase [Oscillochloris sp.]|nr:AAA family ATPase [Oscillochloris sp.]